jgi:hypothetical protein
MEAAYTISRFKRTSPRKEYRADVSFSAGALCYSGMLQNISAGGAQFNSNGLQFLKPGREITISIPFAAKQGSVKRNAIVVWARDDQFGIQFV